MKTYSLFPFLLIITFSLIVIPTFVYAQASSTSVNGYEVSYDIVGGDVFDVNLDADFVELIIDFAAIEDGLVELTIPRGLLDSKLNPSEDDIFFVLVDGFETEYVEVESDPDSRIIIVPFFAGDKELEIIGTEALSSTPPKIEIKEFENPEPEESETTIPEWVKSTAGWWADGTLEDSEFISGIEYLISENIIIIPITQSGPSTGEAIPPWVKNTAGWWADGTIGDSDFISGIQFLITKGIMKV